MTLNGTNDISQDQAMTGPTPQNDRPVIHLSLKGQFNGKKVVIYISAAVDIGLIYGL